MDLLPKATQHFGVSKHFETAGVAVALVRATSSGEPVGWHYHETPHLTFILRGTVIEGTKRTIHHCAPGQLLFHGGFEPHYNRNVENDVRCLHIDFSPDYLAKTPPGKDNLQGIFDVESSDIKLLCYKAFKEAIFADDLPASSIHGIALDILNQLLFCDLSLRNPRPSWVNRLEELLKDKYSETFSLNDLSHELNIHPVHLSRSFSRYFRCTLGEYIRSARIEKSLRLMSRRKLSLTEIATTCGFADQSHFTRSFRRIMGVTPSTYRKIIAS
jgi:AraC-like DNA-binding protein